MAKVAKAKRFLVADISGGATRLIEADSFSIEESGYTVFFDEDSNLVARFINVTVEPYSASRESSKEMVALAMRRINDPDPEVRSLAGSVLSQADPQD